MSLYSNWFLWNTFSYFFTWWIPPLSLCLSLDPPFLRRSFQTPANRGPRLCYPPTPLPSHISAPNPYLCSQPTSYIALSWTYNCHRLILVDLMFPQNLTQGWIPKGYSINPLWMTEQKDPMNLSVFLIRKSLLCWIYRTLICRWPSSQIWMWRTSDSVTASLQISWIKL